MLYIVPIMGGIISTFLTIIFLMINTKLSLLFVINLITILPFLFFNLTIISYFFCFSIGIFLVKLLDKNLLSNNLFMFYAFIVSGIIGFGFAFLIRYFNIDTNITKSIFICLCFALSGLFNSSFYISLKKQIKIINEKK